MDRKTWTVRIFEARTSEEFMKTKVAADFREQFGVSATSSDNAKVEARKWLKSRGHRIRTLGVSAKKEDVRTLVAYVSAGSFAASNAFMTSQASKPRLAMGRRVP